MRKANSSHPVEFSLIILMSVVMDRVGADSPPIMEGEAVYNSLSSPSFQNIRTNKTVPDESIIGNFMDDQKVTNDTSLKITEEGVKISNGIPFQGFDFNSQEVKRSNDKKEYNRKFKYDPALALMGLGKRFPQYDPALKYMGLGKRQSQYNPALKYMGLGKRNYFDDPVWEYDNDHNITEDFYALYGNPTNPSEEMFTDDTFHKRQSKYDPAIKYMGLGKRNFQYNTALKYKVLEKCKYPALNYKGLGKRGSHYDPILKYTGLGKRSSLYNPALKYMGLGKRGFQYDPALKYMGIGKRISDYDLALKYMRFGKRVPDFDPALNYMKFGKREFQYDSALKHIGMGKRRNQYDPAFKYIGLGKRESQYDPALKYIGLGKRESQYDPALKYIGLGKRESQYDPALKYMGLGKRKYQYDPGMKYMGLGKKSELANSHGVDSVNVNKGESLNRDGSRYRSSLNSRLKRSFDYDSTSSINKIYVDDNTLDLGKRPYKYDPALGLIGLGKRNSLNDQMIRKRPFRYKPEIEYRDLGKRKYNYKEKVIKPKSLINYEKENFANYFLNKHMDAKRNEESNGSKFGKNKTSGGKNEEGQQSASGKISHSRDAFMGLDKSSDRDKYLLFYLGQGKNDMLYDNRMYYGSVNDNNHYKNMQKYVDLDDSQIFRRINKPIMNDILELTNHDNESNGCENQCTNMKRIKRDLSSAGIILDTFTSDYGSLKREVPDIRNLDGMKDTELLHSVKRNRDNRPKYNPGWIFIGLGKRFENKNEGISNIEIENAPINGNNNERNTSFDYYYDLFDKIKDKIQNIKLRFDNKIGWYKPLPKHSKLSYGTHKYQVLQSRPITSRILTSNGTPDKWLDYAVSKTRI